MKLDDLPTELLMAILKNVRCLVHLRLVNTRWKAVVEDICRSQRSLILTNQVDVARYDDYICGLWLNPADFAVFRMPS